MTRRNAGSGIKIVFLHEVPGYRTLADPKRSWAHFIFGSGSGISRLKMFVFFLVFSSFSALTSGQYLPTWESLDSRPLPQWYDDAKFGVMIHWGVYSVPSFGSEWFWNHWKQMNYSSCIQFMKKNYPPGFTYADFAPMFKAEFFDPDVFTDLIEKSGAKYVVFTSKHHEGWTNWASNSSWNWNSVDNGPHRDLVGAIASSLRQRTNITFGLYYSLYEWFNPLYLQDKRNGLKTNVFIQDKVLPELHDIVNKYKPEYIWSDGDWDASDTYWQSKTFLAWLFNESPVKDTVVVNDRWGAGCICHHGSVYTCSDNYHPGVLIRHKWENAMPMDKDSWGYRRNATQLVDYNSVHELIAELVSTVSCGGNFLLNVGPTADGRIIPAFQERLLQIGEWLSINGEAIYESKPWRAQNDSITKNIWYTSKGSVTYAILLEWPDSGQLELGQPIASQETVITLLGYPGYFKWTPRQSGQGIVMTIPFIPFKKLPSTLAWTIKLLNVS